MSKKYKITGDVQFVNEKDGRYSVLLDNDKWYGCGDEKPRCEKGDKVQFVYETNEKNGYTFRNMDQETLKVKKGQGTVKPYKGKGGKGGGKSAAQSKYWEERSKQDAVRFEFEQQRHKDIAYQSARNAAIAFLAILKDVGALPIAKLKSPDKIQDAVEAVLGQYTDEFLASIPQATTAATVTEEPEASDEPETEEAESEPKTEGEEVAEEGDDEFDD